MAVKPVQNPDGANFTACMVSKFPQTQLDLNSKPWKTFLDPLGGNTIPLVITFRFGLTVKIPLAASRISYATSEVSDVPRMI